MRWTEDNNEAVLNIRLTDAPAAYDEVNIEIENVQIHVGDNQNEGGWHDVEIMNSGIYNLLEFNNGLDTLLASSYLPAGNASQMRLYLGEKVGRYRSTRYVIGDGNYNQ